jgi:hypothetical protein
MICIPLGKIPVPTPGTVVTLVSVMTAAQVAQLPPGGMVHKIEAWADTADSGTTYLKSASGVKIAPLPVPANGHSEHVCIGHPGNLVNPREYAVDAATATQGPIITMWVA